MTSPSPRTLAARLARFLPTRLVAATARLVYPRFEPELARLGRPLPARLRHGGGRGRLVRPLDAPSGRRGPTAW